MCVSAEDGRKAAVGNTCCGALHYIQAVTSKLCLCCDWISPEKGSLLAATGYPLVPQFCLKDAKLKWWLFSHAQIVVTDNNTCFVRTE